MAAVEDQAVSTGTTEGESRLQQLAKRHLWMHFTQMGGYADHEIPIITRGEGCYVFDEHGTPLGYFRKDFGASLLRSTWHLSAPGLEAIGRERRLGIAILRRVWDFIPYLGDIWVPFVFHFDFTEKSTGQLVLTSERQKSIRDHTSSVV